MKTLLHPIVAVVVCVAAAVWFAAAFRIHAMTPADLSSAADTPELSIPFAGHKTWSAVDFWLP
jgi:hypothetical protein